MCYTIYTILNGGHINMHLLFYTTWDFSQEQTDGIAKKIISEVNAFQQSGFTVDLTYFKDGHAFVQTNFELIDLGSIGISRKFKANYLFSQYLRQHKYIYIYIRYGFSDLFFIKSLQLLKQNHLAKIVLEIPTYPYDAELRQNLLYRILLLSDKLTRRKLVHYIDQIATYSEDKFIYQIPTIYIKNGIEISNTPLRSITTNSKTINIIAVASIATWHAYDRLIEGIGQYYAQGGNRNIIFHLVGSGAELSKYSYIVNKWGIHAHVIFYGQKSGSELDAIYDKCDLAVDGFGYFKKGMKLSSSLKTREYTAKGLPQISATMIDLFQDSDSQYFLKVPEDDSAININDIIAFYDSLYDGSIECKQKVANNIRKIAEQKCDMSITMLPVINYFKS